MKCSVCDEQFTQLTKLVFGLNGSCNKCSSVVQIKPVLDGLISAFSFMMWCLILALSHRFRLEQNYLSIVIVIGVFFVLRWVSVISGNIQFKTRQEPGAGYTFILAILLVSGIMMLIVFMASKLRI